MMKRVFAVGAGLIGGILLSGILTAAIVPLLPPRDIIDVLDGKTYFYQHVTNVVLLTFLKGGAIANHNIDHYIEAIQGLPG